VGNKTLPAEYVVLGNSFLPTGPGHLLTLSWKVDDKKAAGRAAGANVAGKKVTFTTEAYFTPNGGE